MIGPVALVRALVAGFACLDVQAGTAQLLTLQLGFAGELGADGLSRRLPCLGRACGCWCAAVSFLPWLVAGSVIFGAAADALSRFSSSVPVSELGGLAMIAAVIFLLANARSGRR